MRTEPNNPGVEVDMFENAGVVAAKVVDRWAWWQAALKGSIGPIHTEPEQGYYRVRGRNGQWEPVAIWLEDQTWLGYRAGHEVRDVEQLWSFACRNPITFDAYTKAMAGEAFDDEPPAPAGIGDNSGDIDPFEAIRVELAGEVDQARAFLKQPVKTQADADRAGIWSKRIGEIAKRAESQRVVEKEPHLAASRAVDSKWRTVIDEAKDQTAALKKHVEPFLIAEKRKAEEIARKAREEAERQRREAAKASDEESRASALQAAQEADKAAEVKNASAGRTGARVSIRVEKRAKIVNFDACLMALKDRAEIIELVQSLANRAVKAGFPLAGVEVEEIEKAV